jgi:hypothetical protein
VNPIARFAILLAAALVAAAPPAAETSHTGCVMATEGGDWTFCEPDHCSLLTGKGVGPKLAGHKVTVRGAVHEANVSAPRMIVVSSVISVGPACADRCRLPPIHRGFGPKEHPGSEGGTPGVTPPQPQPQ